jgi:hypothetical protein
MFILNFVPFVLTFVIPVRPESSGHQGPDSYRDHKGSKALFNQTLLFTILSGEEILY